MLALRFKLMVLISRKYDPLIVKLQGLTMKESTQAGLIIKQKGYCRGKSIQLIGCITETFTAIERPSRVNFRTAPLNYCLQ